MAQVGTELGGNTNNPKRRDYFFTFNNYLVSDIENLIKDFDGTAKRYIFQEEKGENGTPHLQGYVYFKNARSFSSIQNLMRKQAHLEKPHNAEECIKYCQKTESRIGKIFSKGITKKTTITNFKEWQSEIIKTINEEPDDRTIWWYWDEKGHSGKTTLCKYIYDNYEDVAYISGAAKDMKYSVAKLIEDGKTPSIILIDIPRSISGYISYSGIEEIKNGIFFSGKYEAVTCRLNSPHIFVFANVEPEKNQLSEDRWKIINIDK